jgi:hypothetical protein
MKCKMCKKEFDDEYCSMTCFISDTERHSDLSCPFCGEKGFDAMGLKYHLRRYCKQYIDISEE